MNYSVFMAFLMFLLVACVPSEQITGSVLVKPSLVNRSTEGLSEATETAVIAPEEGDMLQFSADIVKKNVEGNVIRMLGYNGQIPGPLVKVRQGQTIWINLTNNFEMETTLHSHGIRIENQYDGVPGITQPPIQPGESFLYKVNFPDAGMYWYHPHVREDYQQDLGLYGNYWVMFKDDIENSVNREEVVMLDDIKIKDGDVAPYDYDEINHALMGRFGNVMLVNGKAEPLSLKVKKGEVVRFYLTNVANVRPFKLSFTHAKMKIVGSDLGHYEKEFLSDTLIIGPAERYIVEVLFDKEGLSQFKHSTHHGTYFLGNIEVLPEAASSDYSEDFHTLKEYAVKEELDQFRKYLSKEPDIEWKLSIELPGMPRMMHADEDNIEYEDGMPLINPTTTNSTVEWEIIDVKTGKKNMDLEYNFKMGDMIKIRIFNDPESVHPMQHPMHFHGQRFLVLEKDGEPNDNLVWKDTILLPVGQTVDIILEISNPGMWMAHCHIAEHLQSGMMAMFNVTGD